MDSLFQRLRRRKLVNWGLVYLGGAWFAVEVIDVLGDKFAWPLRLQQGVIILLAFGLPVTLVLAWYHGEKGRQRASGPELFLIAGLLAAAAAVLTIWNPAVDDMTGSAAASVAGRAVPRLASPGGTSLAVLPFRDLAAAEGGGAEGREGEGGASGVFAAGMHDDLLTQLAKIGSLTVLSRTSVMQYEGTTKTVPTIGRELGVTAILAGAVQRAGERVRVNVQLIDAETDEHLWAEKYDRELTVADILAIQSEIATLVARGLEAELTRDEAARIARSPTESLSAYELYLAGREATRERTREGDDEAVELFERALGVDSTFARAWAGLAGVYAFRRLRYGGAEAWIDSAEVAGERALALDPEVAEAHHALGLAALARGDLRRALDVTLQAVEYAPNYHPSVNNIGVFYHLLGEFDEAMRWVRRGSRLAPGDPFLRSNIAGLYIHLGEYERAEAILRALRREAPTLIATREQFASLFRGRHALDSLLVVGEEIAENDPDDPAARHVAGAAAMDAGRFERARAHLSEAVRLAPEGFLRQEDAHFARTALAFLALRDGDPETFERNRATVAASLAAELEGGAGDPWFLWEMGTLRALDGESGEALEWFRSAYEGGWREHRWPEIDPLLDEIRPDPRFRALLAEMAADVDEQRRRVHREEVALGVR